ncbi:alpha/beta-hydrolase [Penicillium macrosclerotiorum]|uniref:alpha/beta-hydrolase n=1 Tax=Penicillium macrosclerotiorum TaxID=303699 RepID=UPI00254793F8|nr:alpha/beta-hydrolase [Penicillium macrosclerotiorum]KAJ5698885.1 alpha/beta-hydrolase [Penicillium macrosclerotiorum]
MAVEKSWPKQLEPGPDGDRFFPVPIGAVWYPKAPVEPPRRLIIHFHAGGYVTFGPRPADGASWGCNRFSEYRLSRDKNTTFSAALQDGITAYVYALEIFKTPPSQIVLAGESAGANMILAMLRYIKNENPALPLPRCALLLSAWVDMSRKTVDDLPKNRNYNRDYVKYDFLDWGQRAFIPPGWDSNNSYFTSLGNEYQLGVPVFFSAGTSELFYDSIIEFPLRLKENGNDVEVHETPNSPHIPFALNKEFDQEEDAALCHALATKFIERTGERGVKRPGMEYATLKLRFTLRGDP